MDRRQLLRAVAGAAAGFSPLLALADDDRKTRRKSGSSTPQALPAPTSPKARVIVLGGGMGGTTLAKYLRMWGDAVDVTLVDRNPSYTSCIMSSLVLTGQRSMSSLAFGYDNLRTRYGVRTVFGEVVAIDPVACRVTLQGGTVLQGDRLVLAPGIAFDEVPGLTQPDAMPHAWKAGPQTSLLALVEEPQGVVGWNGPYLSKPRVPKDPWGRDYHYRIPGEYGEFDLFSYGADNNPGGEKDDADIVSWE